MLLGTLKKIEGKSTYKNLYDELHILKYQTAHMKTNTYIKRTY